METKGPVCVTGGSGFLGSWCVAQLLEKGYTVHATTRSAKKAAHLLKLPGAAERLKIFEGCDLLKIGSFGNAMHGCKTVLHTASPFYSQGGTEEALVKPAVDGTRNVLTSCVAHEVENVVLTASTANVYVVYGTTDPSKVFTNTDWTPEELLREKENWYTMGKLEAERLAWEMSKEPHRGKPFNLAVMLPCLILGPMLPGQSHLNTSCAALTAYMDGKKKEIEHGCKSVVDVRDVAAAHIAAFERETVWEQRVLLVGGNPHWAEIAGYIHHALPPALKDNVPKMVSSELGPAVLGAPPPLPTLCDASVAETELGIKYHTVCQMVTDSVKSMVENGFTSIDQYEPGK